MTGSRPRLKHVADLRAGGTPDTGDPAYWADDGGTRWVAISDMSHGGTVHGTAKAVSDAGLASKGLPVGEPGTVLLAMYATVGAAATLGIRATWNQAILGIVPKSTRADPRFLRYWLESVRPEWMAAVRSNTQDNLNAEIVGGARFPPIPSEQQSAIADYLDAETARIDGLVTAKLRLTRLIEHRRSTLVGDVISGRHAISRSAIADAPVRTLRVFCEVTLGAARSPERMNGRHTVPYLRAGNVKNGYLDLDTVMEMSFTPPELRELALTHGDVLVTEGAGSLAAVGANAVWRGEISGVVCFQNHLLRLRATDRSDPRFIAWWARFAYDSGLFASLATGAQILNLGASSVRRLPVRMPDRKAQSEIADVLEAAVGALDTVRERLTHQVVLLRERRQALITAAVTGQIEIPGVAA